MALRPWVSPGVPLLDLQQTTTCGERSATPQEAGPSGWETPRFPVEKGASPSDEDDVGLAASVWGVFHKWFTLSTWQVAGASVYPPLRSG